jgi:hypothetical protein
LSALSETSLYSSVTSTSQSTRMECMLGVSRPARRRCCPTRGGAWPAPPWSGGVDVGGVGRAELWVPLLVIRGGVGAGGVGRRIGRGPGLGGAEKALLPGGLGAVVVVIVVCGIGRAWAAR